MIAFPEAPTDPNRTYLRYKIAVDYIADRRDRGSRENFGQYDISNLSREYFVFVQINLPSELQMICRRNTPGRSSIASIEFRHCKKTKRQCNGQRDKGRLTGRQRNGNGETKRRKWRDKETHIGRQRHAHEETKKYMERQRDTHGETRQSNAYGEIMRQLRELLSACRNLSGVILRLLKERRRICERWWTHSLLPSDCVRF